ncbi:MAG: hypothetical protein IPJ29_16485 [Chitinophagaceae bacterium]|nr:hypothetical protein [Chitinophagaceae bacterium]
MGIPIICNDIGDTGQIVEKSDSGLVVKQFNKEGYEAVVAKLNVLNSMDQNKIRNLPLLIMIFSREFIRMHRCIKNLKDENTIHGTIPCQ